MAAARAEAGRAAAVRSALEHQEQARVLALLEGGGEQVGARQRVDPLGLGLGEVDLRRAAASAAAPCCRAARRARPAGRPAGRTAPAPAAASRDGRPPRRPSAAEAAAASRPCRRPRRSGTCRATARAPRAAAAGGARSDALPLGIEPFLPRPLSVYITPLPVDQLDVAADGRRLQRDARAGARRSPDRSRGSRRAGPRRRGGTSRRRARRSAPPSQLVPGRSAATPTRCSAGAPRETSSARIVPSTTTASATPISAPTAKLKRERKGGSASSGAAAPRTVAGRRPEAHAGACAPRRRARGCRRCGRRSSEDSGSGRPAGEGGGIRSWAMCPRRARRSPAARAVPPRAARRRRRRRARRRRRGGRRPAPRRPCSA